MDSERASALPPHVLIFPLPIQGPVKCMLKLAELFCINGLKVTFLNSQHIQRCLSSCTNTESYFQRYPNFRFETVPDGLPEDNPRTVNEFFEMLDSMKAVGVPLFREMVTSGPYGPNSENPITCIVADGAFCFAVDIAKQIGVPLLYFDTMSPCCVWTYLCLPKLIEAGEVPFKGDNLDEIVVNAPGKEGFLRRRDLPGFYRTKDLNDPNIQSVLKENRNLPLSQGLILNTFEELDASILSEMSKVCPKIYAVGPLHTHVKTRLRTGTTSNSILKEDRSCIPWLDMQPLKSVLFVSIGSLAVMTKEQLMEIWYGLVNSGTRFLWVRRPGSVVGLDKEFEISMDFSQATKERGYIVSWAPQEEVLAHPAIGGFLTHSGWNSTLESIVEGKPMICWPYYVDQQVNSRYVGEFWKLGLDMKDICDRVKVEGMIKELMELKKDEFCRRANHLANIAKASVHEGGSSYKNLDQLIQDIKSMTFSTLQG
ncbi:7-deoxyloganetic acid glucosyltransferase-like [Olea europaea subsp. europaea]|uniref:Glycosyltransferase n=1 Tax=Olea europaea subsp. europaea TaxID=158383 RepID=A0A8S0QZY7_OLEEU|nr:7-deoxyloganetic acid glucosyltransferase-like [Olea europaea subsp. europaea]